MGTKPFFLILTGATADAERFNACQELARKHWPEADVAMPDYLKRWRGLRGVGAWLDAWVASHVPAGQEIYLLAYILGGAALPYAPALVARVRRGVLVRSGYQEQVPMELRRRLGPVAGLVFGKSVWDLGQGVYWPQGFGVPWPKKILVEGRPSKAAKLLKLEAPMLEERGLAGEEELPVDHDFAYHSGRLVSKAVEFLKQA